MLEGDWISQTGPMVCGGDWKGLEEGTQREQASLGVGGCPHWAGKIKTEGHMKKREPGKDSRGKVE